MDTLEIIAIILLSASALLYIVSIVGKWIQSK